MTDEMKKLNRMIEVMNAYRKGEFIQSRCMDTDNWTDEDKPSWNWGLFDYRIKPEPEKNERRVRIMKARELKDWIEGVDDDADVVIKVTNKEDRSTFRHCSCCWMSSVLMRCADSSVNSLTWTMRKSRTSCRTFRTIRKMRWTDWKTF